MAGWYPDGTPTGPNPRRPQETTAMYETIADGKSESADNYDHTMLDVGDEVRVEYDSAYSDERQTISGTVTVSEKYRTTIDAGEDADGEPQIYHVSGVTVKSDTGGRISDKFGADLTVERAVGDDTSDDDADDENDDEADDEDDDDAETDDKQTVLNVGDVTDMLNGDVKVHRPTPKITKLNTVYWIVRGPAHTLKTLRSMVKNMTPFVVVEADGSGSQYRVKMVHNDRLEEYNDEKDDDEDDDDDEDAETDGGTDGYRGLGDSTADHRPEDDAVIMTDGGTPTVNERYEGETATCEYGHPACEGVDADRDRPELCFDHWDEWAAYDPEDHLLDEDADNDEDPDGGEDKTDYGQDTCAVPTCNEPAPDDAQASRQGFCEDHATDAEIMTDGGTRVGRGGNDDMDPEVNDLEAGDVLDIPRFGVFEIVGVDNGGTFAETRYQVANVKTGGEKDLPEWDLQAAFDLGARVVGGAGE